MNAPLHIERDDRVMVMTLNRPQRLNALDHDLRGRVVAALAEAGEDAEIRALVVTGAGERAFCAGQDLNESAALGADDGPSWMESWTGYFSAFAASRKPVIAAINGVAAGAGFETALLSDIRIAAAGARFLMAEADVGLPAIVGQYLLEIHLGHSRAAELVLTARSLSAEEARDTGLVRQVVPAAALRDAALATARALADKPAVATRLTLARLREGLTAGLDDAEAAARRYHSEAVASGEPQKTMQAFLARRGGRVAERT